MRPNTRAVLIQASAALSALIAPAAAARIPRASSCTNPTGQISLLGSDPLTYFSLDQTSKAFQTLDASQATTFQLDVCEMTDPTDTFDILIQADGLGSTDFLGVVGTVDGVWTGYSSDLLLAPVAQGADGTYQNTNIAPMDGKQTVSTIWTYDTSAGTFSVQLPIGGGSSTAFSVAGVTNLTSDGDKYVVFPALYPSYRMSWVPQPAQNGAQCGGTGLTGPIVCDTGLTCTTSTDGSESTCVPNVQPAKKGEHCGQLASQGLIPCAAGLACIANVGFNRWSTCQTVNQQSCQSTSKNKQHEDGQCGGWGWWSPQQCQDGLACIERNSFYSQCLHLDAHSANPCSSPGQAEAH